MINYRITHRPSSLPNVSDNAMDLERYIDNRKSSVCSKVEHAFKIIKGTFGFSKVGYRGIDKNLHNTVNGEEIVTTPTHPFYVPEKGWTSAIELRAGDQLQLVNGQYVTVEKVQHELLEKPVKVYNFEVEDFHTYYVGTNLQVLVHNMCQKNSKITVGRWMSQSEYEKMVATGRVQVSPNGNTTYVASPADINAYSKQAKKGSIYVEFDVDASSVQPAGREGWAQIPGPDSLYDRLNQKKGLPPINDMPKASNIVVKGKKE